MNDYLFTSESVTDGHPDKVADQLSDAVLDAYLTEDPEARVACETLVTTNRVILAGEVHSSANLSDRLEALVRRVVSEIGYDDPKLGFDAKSFNFTSLIHEQSREIRKGVDEGGAGDQGMMFGYACNETPQLMPLPIMIAHAITHRLTECRKNKILPWLRPDGKAQVTIQYRNHRPFFLRKILVSAQHDEGISPAQIEEAIIEEVVKPVLPKTLYHAIDYLINPSGSFIKGGPDGDTGLTGRKIIVDTYGGSCPHGGGAFSGKDPSKVDRSGAYAARHIAKNIVAAGLADRCLVQVSYAIGQREPVSYYLEFFLTGKISERIVEGQIFQSYDLSPQGIIDSFSLKSPIYRKTTNYGHFGRELPDFCWEKTNLAEELSRE